LALLLWFNALLLVLVLIVQCDGLCLSLET